jgi:hypothetical protein
MAKKLTAEQAKKLAYGMFVNEDKTFVEISEVVGFTPVSIGNWARDGKWKDLKGLLKTTSDNQLRNFVTQLNELNINISKRDEGFRFPNSKEADIQIKLSKAILMFRGEADIADMLTYNRMFLQFLRANHSEKLKEYALLFDEFIKGRL